MNFRFVAPLLKRGAIGKPPQQRDTEPAPTQDVGESLRVAAAAPDGAKKLASATGDGLPNFRKFPGIFMLRGCLCFVISYSPKGYRTFSTTVREPANTRKKIVRKQTPPVTRARCAVYPILWGHMALLRFFSIF